MFAISFERCFGSLEKTYRPYVGQERPYHDIYPYIGNGQRCVEGQACRSRNLA